MERDTDREDFLWVQTPVVADERMRASYLALANRYDLAALVSQPNASDPGAVEAVEVVLRAAADRGVDAWLNTGVLKDATAREFVEDAATRRRELRRLRDLVVAYAEYEPSGRVVLWQEAPVSGRWVESGAWTGESVDNLREYGPRVFAAQYRAVKSASDDVRVGVFVHFPYVVDSKHPEVYARLLDDVHDRGVQPDFAFTDFYRGYYEANTGAGDANDAVRSLVSNARAGVRGRPVFYMGEPHTINNGYTPSKAAMAMDHRTAVDAGAAGLGWYPRPQYRRTTAGFNPYLSNDGDLGIPDGTRATTATFARDRFQYAYARLAASRRGDADRFDLWLDADDAGALDHALHLRGPAGFEHVADFAGYLTLDGRHVTVVRGLARDRYLRDGALRARVETRRGDARLRSVAAMPFVPDAFVSEFRATRLAADRDLRLYALGRTAADAALRPDRDVTFRVPASPPDRAFDALVHPDHRDARRALARLEARDGFEATAYLDLWVVGDSLDADALRSLPGDPVGDAAAVAADDDGAVCYGLPRRPYLDALRRIDTVDAPVAALAVPYVGRAAFKTGSDVARLVREFPDAARVFALAAVA